MPTTGEHKTVQACILKYAQDVGKTYFFCNKTEERWAGFPTRQSGRDPGINAHGPLSLFPSEDRQEEICSALAAHDPKANFAK